MIAAALRRSLHVGQRIPRTELVLVSPNGFSYDIEAHVSTDTFFSEKKVVLVGFPGAFTPVCHKEHLPGFVSQAEAFKAKGATLLGLAVNDPFTLKEFGEELAGSLSFIADGTAALTRSLDAGIDLTEQCLGYRTRRFTALVEDGVITVLNDENSHKLTEVSTAETILKAL